ncbi:MAG: RNA polymerase sigma factor [bacterium]|nr:RNA polymerase sigma factor [bacterium]
MDPIDHDEKRDRALIEAALDGDVRALEQLLLAHESRVLRVLRLMGVTAADREDVAQEVFLRVFRHLSRFRRGHAFGGWIYRITVNAAHDHRKKAGARRRSEAAWDSDLDEAPDEGPDPAEAASRAERARRLEQAVEQLSEREREAFVLCELEGLETRQVAQALGVTSITVRRHLSRARRRLQRILAEEKKS